MWRLGQGVGENGERMKNGGMVQNGDDEDDQNLV